MEQKKCSRILIQNFKSFSKEKFKHKICKTSNFNHEPKCYKKLFLPKIRQKLFYFKI